MTPENREREEFEAWYAAPDAPRRRPDGDYVHPQTNLLWMCWQAARASQQAGPQSLPVEAIRFAVTILEERAARCLSSTSEDSGTEYRVHARSLRSLLPKSPDQAQPEEKA